MDAFIHVQNGGSNGQGQVALHSSAKVTDWFTVAFERVPGDYFAWYVNGELIELVQVEYLSSPYGVPENDLRWTLQLEDSQGGSPTQEAIVVYDWASLLVPR